MVPPGSFIEIQFETLLLSLWMRSCQLAFRRMIISFVAGRLPSCSTYENWLVPPLILIKHSSHTPAAPVNVEDEFSASWAPPRNRKMADWSAVGFQCLKIRFELLCPVVWAQMALVAQAIHLLGQPSVFRNKFIQRIRGGWPAPFQSVVPENS